MARTGVFPEHVKGFLEAVRPYGLEIIGEHVVEPGPLSHGEIFRSLQKAVARFVEDWIVALVVESLGFLAAGFIHGFIEFFHDVEAIQDVQSQREHLFDDVEIGFPHVRADDGDGGAAFRSQGVEPFCQGAFPTVPDNADEAS